MFKTLDEAVKVIEKQRTTLSEKWQVWIPGIGPMDV